MTINGRRNKPIGPGGQYSVALHPCTARELEIASVSRLHRRGRNSDRRGVKGVFCSAMVPPLSGPIHSMTNDNYAPVAQAALTAVWNTILEALTG